MAQFSPFSICADFLWFHTRAEQRKEVITRVDVPQKVRAVLDSALVGVLLCNLPLDLILGLS